MSADFMPKTRQYRLASQPLAGIVTSAIGLGIVTASWLARPPVFTSQTVVVALLLVGGLLLASQFPIHIRYVTKIYIGSVPLYLMAVLLPPPLAALTAGLGIAGCELAVQRKKGLYFSDIGCQAGRWMLVELAGSVVVHAPLGGSLAYVLLLIAGALILQVGDVLTAPISIVPLSGERPLHVILECARQVGLPEAGQYFTGFLGALLAMNDVWAVSLLILPLALVYRIAKRAKEMHNTTRRLLENMADSIDERDPYTHNHSVRVTEWTRQLLKEMNVVGLEAELIVTAARVHDVGKIAIPESILHKHEMLTPDEWSIVETHPAAGATMLNRYPAFARGVEIVRGHHERWDGQGYPDKLKGTDIPFGARVVAVADSLDAMTSDRPYRAGMTVERAAAILRGGSGTQWDPAVIDAFARLSVEQVGMIRRSPANDSSEALERRHGAPVSAPSASRTA